MSDQSDQCKLYYIWFHVYFMKHRQAFTRNKNNYVRSSLILNF